MYKQLVAGRLSQFGVQLETSGTQAHFTFKNGESFALEVCDPRLWRDWVRRGSFGLGETYVDNKWDIAPDRLEPFIRALMHHGCAELRPLEKLYHKVVRAFGVGHDADDPSSSHRHSSHHYDRGNDLFKSFLDDDMVYSCAFFDDPGWDLETAQRQKIDVTLDRLDMSKGARLLDIGCGWGTVAIEAARRGAKASGITLSDEQITLARERAAEQQMKVDFQVADYRTFADAHAGTFDRIVSVGMIEHVGRRQYGAFFDAIHKLLKPGGKALVHSEVDWPFGPIIPWLERYIFPGGEVPRTNDLIREASRAGLRVEAGPYRHDGFNYATTLAHWRQRFLANYPKLDQEKYPERFRRMWLLYLAGCEAAFRGTSLHVVQAVYTR
ncbi:MAG: class I SAM-dependent methyltransferase [Methyloligellaceae bacterium]